MFTLDKSDLLQFRDAGGERFANFVDRLIRSEAWRCGLPQCDVRTQLRTNVGDGGVDTHVMKPVPASPNGWFADPTCWQFKAKNSITENELRTEINKRYCKQLIQEGCAYRLCLLGDVGPEKVARWEAILREEAQRIAAQARDPRVVVASDLLTWAGQLPGVTLWAKNFTEGTVLHFEAWARSPRAVTPIYVPNTQWVPIQERILAHVNFGMQPLGGDPCLKVGGAAGVGKTRLVLETLGDSFVLPGLVVYAADEQEAKAVALRIANDGTQSAILVADECGDDTQFSLSERLRGHVSRLRVICIDNAGSRRTTLESQIWLSDEPVEHTVAVLRENFRNVPRDRHYHYARLSGGFVRLAADMCHHYFELGGGDISALVGSTGQYVRRRLKGEQLRLVSLLALFHKVGSSGEVRGDLDALCQMAAVSAQQFYDTVRQIRDSPGFVVQAGRYWYVTPEIVARVLFNEGWECWVANDPGHFLDQLPDRLRAEFLDRAAKFGGGEVREQLGHFFRQWFMKLSAVDLRDANAMVLAGTAVEANPDEYLPLLRSVIAAASSEDLRRIGGHPFGSRRGPRRTLVWLLENLVSFPEFFHDCEECLFRLALCESEPQIANNATGIWQQLFCVQLSGTATSFETRLAVLRARTAAEAPHEVSLAFQGLARGLEHARGKVIGPPVVAGRLRPPDWEPGTETEDKACHIGALRLCADLLSKGGPVQHKGAFSVITKSIWFLLHQGLAEDLASSVPRDVLTDDECRALVNAVDHFLQVKDSLGRSDAHHPEAAYIAYVRAWIDSFRPQSFDGQLRAVVSRSPWDRRFATDVTRTRDELDDLADAIVVTPSRLESHLEWLSTPEAQAAERLGTTLGRLDAEERCAQMIAAHALATGDVPLLRGYIRGLVFCDRRPTKELRELISRLTAAHPEAAADVLTCGGDAFDAINQVSRLVGAGKVPARALAPFAMGVGRRELNAAEIGRLLGFFIHAITDGDLESGRSAIRFLWFVINGERHRGGQGCFENDTVRTNTWEVIRLSERIVDDHTAHDWSEIVKSLAPYDAERACQFLGAAMIGEHLGLEREAKERMTELAPTYPSAVMEGFGWALLDQQRGWHLQVTVCRDLLAAIPDELAIAWVRRHGVLGARAIARHLSVPFIDPAGMPTVSKTLDSVLREYDDKEVFQSFLAGAGSHEGWWGDGSVEFRERAREAKAFLSHSNPKIREWAKYEIERCESMAKEESMRHAERHLPD